MRPLFDFLLKMFIFSLTLWGAIYFWLSPQVNTEPIFYAWLLMAVNTLVGYLIFENAYGDDAGTFNMYVFGGFGVRLLAVMVIVAIVLINDLLPIKEFLLSMFAFYVVYVILEIIGYQKKNQYEKTVTKNK